MLLPKVWPSVSSRQAMALDAVAEDFVEEHTGGAAGEDGGAHEWFGLAGFEEFLNLGGDALNGRTQVVFFGQVIEVSGLEAVGGQEVLPIRRLCPGDNGEAHKQAAELKPGSVGGDEGLAFPAHPEGDFAGEHGGELVEFGGEAAQARLPFVAGDGDTREGEDGLIGLLFGEVSQSGLGGGGLQFDAGLEAGETLAGGAVGPVGFGPKDALEGGSTVLEGESAAAGEARPFAIEGVVVIKFPAADADTEIEGPGLLFGAPLQTAEGGGDDFALLFRHRIRDEVGGRIAFLLENLKVAIQLLLQDVDEGGLRGLRWSDKPAGQGEQSSESNRAHNPENITRPSGDHFNRGEHLTAGFAVSDAIKGQAVAAAHAGLLEDVLQVDLDGARANAKFQSDFAVFEALFDEFQNLHLTRRELGVAVAILAESFTEDAVVHPVRARAHGTKAGENGGQVGGLPENATGSSLEQTEGFGLRDGDAPHDGGSPDHAQDSEGVEDRLQAERLVDDDQVRLLEAGEFQTEGKAVREPTAFQIRRSGQNGAQPFGGRGLGFAEAGAQGRDSQGKL